ncbi:GGDEF domain-containing protein [Lactococcus garvieae]|uniref:GGDEF domain-containing protein n=1 Tax=Lactococcus garvieae TaxID=1363 RepID=UPI003854F9EB
MQSIGKMLVVSLCILVSVQLLALSQFPFNGVYSAGIFCKIFIILLVSKFVFSAISKITEEYSNYKKFTYIDTLTNAYNRRKFEETITGIINSERISKLSLVFFDVDSFKCINDNYGHDSGDYVLKEICYLIEKNLREWGENGQLFRYGGDEFFLIFRNRSGEEVRNIMGDLVKRVSEFEFYNNNQRIDVSISVGVSEIIDEMTIEQAIRIVDENLYIAKARGKNQVYYK